MNREVILDTGPLVAFLDRKDNYHDWALAAWDDIEPPMLTCESVLSEACFLLSGTSGGPAAVMALLERGSIRIAFDLESDCGVVAKLMARYANVPMSLADACVVRQSELCSRGRVLTLDADFRIYRRHGRQTIPLLIPDDI